MNLSEFEQHIRQHAMYETIYDDSEGRRILVIRALDAYALVNRLVESRVAELLNSPAVMRQIIDAGLLSSNPAGLKKRTQDGNH
jgi:hypothetical protein